MAKIRYRTKKGTYIAPKGSCEVKTSYIFTSPESRIVVSSYKSLPVTSELLHNLAEDDIIDEVKEEKLKSLEYYYEVIGIRANLKTPEERKFFITSFMSYSPLTLLMLVLKEITTDFHKDMKIAPDRIVSTIDPTSGTFVEVTAADCQDDFSPIFLDEGEARRAYVISKPLYDKVFPTK